jgi:transposase
MGGTCLAFTASQSAGLLNPAVGCGRVDFVKEAHTPWDSSQLDPRDQRIAELEAELKERDRLIAALQEQLRQVQEELARLKQASKRQATPFAREKRVAQAKRPGRKQGQGQFCYRHKPLLEEVAEHKEALLCCCPTCGSELLDAKEHEQFVVDIPKAHSQNIRYLTQSGYCGRCRKRVHSRHPEQISTATGAAGVVVGPRAKALAAELKHRLGLSYGKVCTLLNELFGLRVSRGAWCQADLRLAQQAKAVYQALVESLRGSAVVNADETGWRVGTLSAWLWVFSQQEVTVYTIKHSRGHEVVLDILGARFAGVLVSDCFLAYDAKALDGWLKQKCVAHLLRNLSELEVSKSRGAVRFAREVSALLQEAIQLKADKATISPALFASRVQLLERRLDALIDGKRRLTDPDNARFARRLRKHREHLLRFLYVDVLDATNNQAERMLRPAVISRKTTGCNKTAQGAEAHAILASILATCHQQAVPVLDFLVRLQQDRERPPSIGPPQTTST